MRNPMRDLFPHLGPEPVTGRDLNPENVTVRVEPYTESTRRWLDASDHYLENAVPGAFFCVVVRPERAGLFGGVPDETRLLGCCTVGRPTARWLPQDGSMGEVTRMFLVPGLAHGTASRVLWVAAVELRRRGGLSLIAYHDRTRHTGCIYRKAGFRRWPVNGKHTSTKGWGSRDGRVSADLPPTNKRRWRLDLASLVAPAPVVRDVPADSPGAREAAYHLALRLMFPEEVLGGWECQECGGEGLHFRDCAKRLSEDEGAEGVWDGRWTNTTTKNGGR